MRNKQKIESGTRVTGFNVRKVTPLTEIDSIAYEMEHEKCGARFLHIHTKDQENLFSIAFRTPPYDDTGAPHILEHSTLGGSKKYPVKEPFVELLKMSMATFVNAMTYPDKTVYPIASNVKKDFWNLADVYFDACFHPNISELTLKQEGHHLDFKKPGNIQTPLIIKGIVYNEMKGAYSSPDRLLSRHLLHNLFPDTPYGNDSGGDPDRIPDLTYKQFISFYKKYYHPSNAYFFSYGDIQTEEHCFFLDERLKDFSRKDINTQISPQKKWKAPKETTQPYSVSENTDMKGKALIATSWLTGSGTDSVDVFAMEILEQILLGSAAAPLTKAIIDSRLGDDIISIGFASGTLETSFGVGIRGSEGKHKDAFNRLITDTLNSVIHKKIPPCDVDAAFKQLEYQYQEIPQRYPLWIMDRVLTTWLYDADPLIFLETKKYLGTLKKLYEQDSNFFEKLIQEKLLNNAHRLTISLIPEKGLTQKKEDAFALNMALIKEKFSEEELQTISEEALELETLQNTPNSEESLATLPRLTIEDIPKKPIEIPSTSLKTMAGPLFLKNDVFSNGVNYLNLAFDLTGLPDSLYDYLPLFGFCFSKLGAGEDNYVDMAKRKEANASGIVASSSVRYHTVNTQSLVQSFQVRGKSLDQTFPEFLKILHDLIFDLDFSDTKRLKDVFSQLKSRLVSRTSSAGMTLSSLWASRGENSLGHLNNRLSGIPQFRQIHHLVDRFDGEIENIVTNLELIKKFLLNRNRISCSVTAPEKIAKQAQKALEHFASQMEDSPIREELPAFTRLEPAKEALIYPSEVAYCTWKIPAKPSSDEDIVFLKIFAKLLRYGYMWEEIRAKGGAYGAPVAYLSNNHTFLLASFRDPNIKKTLDIFEGTLQYIKKTNWTKNEIEQAIIATAKEDNIPLRPTTASGQILNQVLLGEDREYRLKRREALLSATPVKVKQAALQLFEKGEMKARCCVFSGKEKVERENEQMDSPLNIEEIMKI